jgi:hypothetical protein
MTSKMFWVWGCASPYAEAQHPELKHRVRQALRQGTSSTLDAVFRAAWCHQTLISRQFTTTTGKTIHHSVQTAM